MARPVIDRTVEIEGQSYRLILDINAQVLLEEHFRREDGKEVVFAEVLDRVNAGSRRHDRAMFWAMCRRHHPSVTLEQAGDLMSCVDVPEVMVGALEDATPDPDDVKALGLKPKRRPRKAPAA